MRKLLQKVLTLSMALCFCASLITLPVHADRPEDTSTKAYIHHVQDVFTENKTEVTITVPGKDGSSQSYDCVVSGEKLVVEMGTQDNSFHLDDGETLEISYEYTDMSNTTVTGSITIENQEGNGPKEPDKGNNNYKVYVPKADGTGDGGNGDGGNGDGGNGDGGNGDGDGGNGDGGNGDGGDGDGDDTGNIVITEIPEGDVPRTTFTFRRTTNNVPQVHNDGDLSDEVEIPDDEVPLADAPKTGDTSLLWLALCGLSGAGMLGLKRKRKIEE